MAVHLDAATADQALARIALPRDSGSHADVFGAVGLADLLDATTNDPQVRIQQRGASFDVVPSRALTAADFAGLRPDPGYPYLRAKRGAAVPPAVSEILDYEEIRDRVNPLRKQEDELYKAAQRSRTRPDPDALEALRRQWPMPRDRWRRFQVYVTLQGDEIANKVHEAIARASPDEFRSLVGQALQNLARGSPSGVAWPVSTVQLFSPLAAKGYARLKPDGTARGDKTKDAWADPFVEWLRYRGYFRAAVPVFHGSKGEHIRLLCPVPADVTISVYRQVVAELAATSLGAGPPKIDALATLSLARLLVERSEYAGAGVTRIKELRITGRRPAQVIDGLAVTNYQSLGQARAVSTMVELAVPGWFPIGSAQDAQDWLAILDEHQSIVRGLQDDHSDEFALLQGYRRFLERRGDGALDAFLEFAGAYGAFVVRAREARRRVRQFTTRNLRRVVSSMKSEYGSILDDEWFRAVAAAVRRATVSAQSLKAQGVDHREIRYGLLPELRRARELPTNEPLLTAVAEFISLYNAENARRQEMTGRPWHSRVSTEELASFTRLVDQHGASVVGALLCAYGSCTDRREADATDEGAAQAASTATE